MPKEDRVVFQVSDLHNTGCTNQSGAARRPARLESWVEVRNVDDAPTVVLLKAGADVCGVCARTPAGGMGACKAPRSTPGYQASPAMARKSAGAAA